jgi:Gluconate 2-dehydrogenase subunit 3
MKRRDMLRDILLLSAGITLIPSCAGPDQKASVAFSNINLSASQEKWLETLASMILPAPKDSYEKSLPLHLLALKMINDCFSIKDLDSFNLGLKSFEDSCKKQYGNSFDALEKESQIKVLQELEKKVGPSLPVNSFYHTYKNQLIRCYMNSKDYLVKIRNYNIIPGPYQACIPVVA